jgi:predicted dehydrogenase
VQQHPGFFLSAIHDSSQERLLSAAGENIHAYKYLDDALDKTHPQLVFVCTPISDISATSCRLLRRHVDVVACKPGATSLAEYERIISIADKYHRAYTVDYTTIIAPSFARLQRRLSGHHIQSIEAIRFATTQRSTADIIDDLVVHDAAMITQLVDTTEPHFIEATRSTSTATMRFRAGETSITITADRAANRTARILRIVTDKATITYDQAAEEEVPTPVMARLDWLASCTHNPAQRQDNREVVRRVITLTDRMKLEAA